MGKLSLTGLPSNLNLHCFVLRQNSIKDLEDDFSPLNEVHDVQALRLSDEITTEVTSEGVVTQHESGDSHFVAIATEAHVTSTTITRSTSARDALHADVDSVGSASTLVAPEAVLGGDVPFEHYASRDSVSGSRSRNPSGEPVVRRGSTNFVPHKGHLLSRDTSLASLGQVTREDSTPTVVTDDDRESSVDVFDAVTSDNIDAREMRDDLHCMVEGTLDMEVARDARLLRQLSAELTRERERERLRRRYFDDWFVVSLVGAALAIAGAWFVFRRK